MHNALALFSFSGTIITLVILAAIVIFGSRLILKLMPTSSESVFIQKVETFFKGLGLVIETDEKKIAVVVKAELAKIFPPKTPTSPSVPPTTPASSVSSSRGL